MASVSPSVPTADGEDLQASPDDEGMFFMANISPKKTGLPMYVWISERRGQHDCRVKVSPHHGGKIIPQDMVSVSVRPEIRVVAGGSLPSSDLRLVSEWIELNREAILKYWYRELATDEVFDQLEKIEI